MQYLTSLFFILFFTAIIFVNIARAGKKGFQCRSSSSNTISAKESTSTYNSEIYRKMLTKRLDRLSTKQKPTNLFMGAMCYRTSIVEPTATVICSKCGHSAVFGVYNSNEYLDYQKCNRLLQAMDHYGCKLDLSLDTSSYCPLCAPNDIQFAPPPGVFKYYRDLLSKRLNGEDQQDKPVHYKRNTYIIEAVLRRYCQLALTKDNLRAGIEFFDKEITKKNYEFSGRLLLVFIHNGMSKSVPTNPTILSALLSLVKGEDKLTVNYGKELAIQDYIEELQEILKTQQ